MTTTLNKPDSHLTSIIKPFITRGEVAGVVAAIANKEQILSLDVAGYSDVENKKKIKPDALFWIASQTKPVTGTAFMMLVDEGKVAVSDPVSKYLPAFQDLWMAAEQSPEQMTLKRPSRQITVRDILSHTSGLPFSCKMEQPTLDLLTLRDETLGYSMVPLQSEPGTKYAYSNMGINIAGRLIEVISGLRYEEFLDQRLFGPLGMKDTTFWPSKKQSTRIAKTYKPNADNTKLEAIPTPQLRAPFDDRSRQPMPAGGLFSSTPDMTRFCQMLLNGGEWEGTRYISQASIAEMTRKQTAEGIVEGYGLGWSAGGTWFGHGGALSTNMVIDLAQGLVMVWHLQHSGFVGTGGNAQAAYKAAAMEKFGSAKS